METQTPPTRRLFRRTSDKMIFGVAGGLADYFGVDAVWVRLVFVATVLLGGAGILAYVVLWVIMPTAGDSGPTTAERALERVAHSLRSTPAWIGGALLILGAILVANSFLGWDGGVVWGIVLITLGVLLFLQHENRLPEAPAAPSLSPPAPPAASAASPSVTSGASAVEAPATSELPPALPSEAAPPPPPRVRERSMLGWMTLGALFLVLGVISLLEMEDIVSLSAAQHLALVLAILGAGLLVGAWYGRARWLLVPALLLLPLVLVASLVNVPITGGVGDRRFRHTTVAAVGSHYQLAAGVLTVDLDEVVFGPTPIAIKATNAAGRIVFIVPEGMPLELRAKVGAGQVALFGQTYDGLNVEIKRSYKGRPGATGLLRLDLETSLGQVEVRS